MIENFVTVLVDHEDEIIEKKSRFIAIIHHVASEKEAEEFLELTRKKHWNASHNVYAYRVGLERVVERCSDDGEPSGTAGMPILEVLRGQDLKNVIVIVTRYFGGTLLGTGGLVRAYSAATKEVLATCQQIKHELYNQVDITCDYTLVGKIQYQILQSEQIILDTEYLSNVCFKVLIHYKDTERVIKDLIEISNNNVDIEEKELVYAYKDNGQVMLSS